MPIEPKASLAGGPARFDRATWRELKNKLEQPKAGNLSVWLLVLDSGLASAAVVLGLLPTTLARLGAILLASVALLHGYLLHHECSHRAVFHDDRYNRALGHVLGVLLLYPFLTRRRAHVLHHTWTGDAQGDPANRRAITRFATLSPRGLRLLDRLWRAWFPFLVLNERVGLWRASLAGQDGELPVPAERAASLVYLLIYAVLGLGLWVIGELTLVLGIYLPALALVLWLEEIINLPHHASTPLYERGRTAPLWTQHEVTHSCGSLPVWSRWLLLNFNLHVAHHLFPQLPWYRLGQAQRELAQHGLSAEGPHELAWNRAGRQRPFQQVFAAYLPAVERSPQVAAAPLRS